MPRAEVTLEPSFGYTAYIVSVNVNVVCVSVFNVFCLCKEYFIVCHSLLSYLATVKDEVVPEGVELSVLHSGEEIRMVAALAKLHHDVEDHRPPGASPASGAVDHVDVSQKNVPVKILLLGGQPCRPERPHAATFDEKQYHFRDKTQKKTRRVVKKNDSDKKRQK